MILLSSALSVYSLMVGGLTDFVRNTFIGVGHHH